VTAPGQAAEAEAAYEAEYGPLRDAALARVPLPPTRLPAAEAEVSYQSGPEPTPYEVWLTDDPQATWDDMELEAGR
jgi:hypothetical protein